MHKNQWIGRNSNRKKNPRKYYKKTKSCKLEVENSVMEYQYMRSDK